jgi:hypothetical protein
MNIVFCVVIASCANISCLASVTLVVGRLQLNSVPIWSNSVRICTPWPVFAINVVVVI